MSIERSQPLIQANLITQTYEDTEVLHHLDVAIHPHELTVITGPSGSGKSTLLNILAGIARPTEGEVRYYGRTPEGAEITKLNPGKELDTFRAERAGYVPQKPNLLGSLTAEKNITMPARLAKHVIDEAWVAEVSGALGLQEIWKRKANKLSGGQQQRVSLARALVRRPDVLLADEPSAALDLEAKHELHKLLVERVIRNLGSTVVMVSHDDISSRYADRVIGLEDGRIVSDMQVGQLSR